MAGTSPDRSKRYESSTESTPGNEPPVRDTPGPAKASPDPRLAMSRDAAPKPDQATAVFSRRSLVDTAEAESGSGADRDRDRGTASAAGRGLDEADAAALAGDGGPEAEGSGIDAGSGDGGSDAGLADADADADADTGSSRADADTAPDSPADEAASDAGPTGGEDSGDAAKGLHGSVAAPTDSDEAQEGRDTSGAPDGSLSAGARAADAGQGGGESVRREETSGGEAAAGAGEGARSAADESERADAPGAPAASAARLSGARAGEESDRAAGTDADAEGDTETGTETGTGAGVTDEADSAPRTPHSGNDPKTTTLRVPATGSLAGERAEPEDAVAAGAAGAAQPEDARPADAGEEEYRSADVPPAADGTVHPADARPGAVADDDEPADADDEGAPQGPAAADDESRAGGKPGGEGGAGPEKAVDQPTAVFRAPRPPAVDQPTTMLKLGGAAPKVIRPADRAEGAAAPGDTDRAEAAGHAPAGKDLADPPAPSERTSKFVALKPLDEHAPVTPPAAAPGGPAVTPAEATRALPQVGPERTTQQPLPPKPPLDLLAELTNTPPPRQTPVRTFIRRVKIWTPLAILLVIVFAVAQSLRPLPAATLALTADESYAFKGGKVDLPWPAEGQGWMDVNGIGTVDSFGEQKPVAIGSVAKAMTAYVILKEHPMKAGDKGATIPVDAKAETEGGYDKDGESTLNTVKEGDELSQYDAIAAIMIPSANNIARLLARWDGKGSEEAFVKKMNAAAKDLGMKNTTYTDPSGLKETTVSTAEDQVKLGNALVKMKALTDITRLPEWKDPSGLKHRNYNTLVPYNNAIGIKTGSTTAAGGNLLFAGTQEVGGETAIVVGAILGQHTPPIIDTVNAVSKTAMIAAQDALTSDTILKKGDVVGHVDDGLGGRTPVVVTKNVSAVGWAGKTVKLELDANATIPHEAKPGTMVGSLIVGNGTGDGVKVPVALQETLTEPGFLTKLTRVS